MASRVEQAVMMVVERLNDELPDTQKLDISLSTVLFGKEGKLDSLGLVRLIVATEEQIEEEFGVPISLADEHAMSQEQSPFATLSSLVDYINLRLSEQNGG
jgi:acyl carrier protein